MSTLINSFKKYWRIYLLVLITVISLAIVMGPVFGFELSDETDADTQNQTLDEKYTNLQYSIDLAGGTRIRAPLIGITVENAVVNVDDRSALERNLSNEFEDTSERDITISDIDEEDNDNQTIEFTSTTPTVESVSEVINEYEIEHEQVREGVTDNTIEEAITVLENKIDEAGLPGGSVRSVDMDGRTYILVEVPDVDREGTLQLIEERGELLIDIYYQDEETNEYTNRTVLEQEDFRTIGTPNSGDDTTQPHVPVVLESDAAERFEDYTVETGVAQPGGSNCQFDTDRDNTEPCLLTVIDGDVVYSAGMAASLADDIRAGTWKDDPQFILQTGSFDEAQQLGINLRAGVMPAQLDIDSGEISFVAPEQGETFRLFAVLIGLLATTAVATSISLRYGKAKIAIPMMITAFAEVIILLAIASILQYPIDIAVVAGFLAVIGTGVDDLIIISDRIMGGETPAKSKKIFRRRFRKALWIIMGAAGTTILALAPLAVLELQQLQGFAIFTILGVIAGVLITRPAYGDMLKYLYANDK